MPAARSAATARSATPRSMAARWRRAIRSDADGAAAISSLRRPRPTWSRFASANADRTNVTGTATLRRDGQCVVSLAGTYVAKQYTILNAAAHQRHRSASVVNTNLPVGFKSSLSYDANNAYLNLALTSPRRRAAAEHQSAERRQRDRQFLQPHGGIPLAFGGADAGRADAGLRRNRRPDRSRPRSTR